MKTEAAAAMEHTRLQRPGRHSSSHNGSCAAATHPPALPAATVAASAAAFSWFSAAPTLTFAATTASLLLHPSSSNSSRVNATFNLTFLPTFERARLVDSVRAVILVHGNDVPIWQLGKLFEWYYGQSWEQFACAPVRGIDIRTFVYRHMPEFFHLIKGSGVACTLAPGGELPKPLVLEEPLPQRQTLSKRPTCIYFAAGWCRRGESCGFAHNMKDLAAADASASRKLANAFVPLLAPVIAASAVAAAPSLDSSSSIASMEQELLDLRARSASELDSRDGWPALHPQSSQPPSATANLPAAAAPPERKELNPAAPAFVSASSSPASVAPAPSSRCLSASAAPPLSLSIGHALRCLRDALHVTGPRALLSVLGSTLRKRHGPLFASSRQEPSELGGFKSFLLAHARFFTLERQMDKPHEQLVSWNEQGPPLEEPATGAETATGAAVTATPPRALAAPAAHTVSDSELLEFARLVLLQEEGRPMLHQSLGGLLGSRYGRLFPRPSARSFANFIEAYPQYFQRHKSSRSKAGAVSWIGSGSTASVTPSAAAAPLSHSELLERVRLVLADSSTPMLVSALFNELRQRHGPLFSRSKGKAASRGGLGAFIQSHQQHFQWHDDPRAPWLPLISWKGANAPSNPTSLKPTIATAPAAAAPTPLASELTASFDQVRVTFSGEVAASRSGSQGKHLDPAESKQPSVPAPAAPASSSPLLVSPGAYASTVLLPPPSALAATTFETHPPIRVGTDIATQAYSDWSWSRGPGSAPGHITAREMYGQQLAKH